MTNAQPHRLRLTGCVELLEPTGGSVPLPTRKTLLLLAMLAAAEGGWLRRDRLADAIWEGVEPSSARESLRTALSRLRKALGPGAILVEAERIALGAAVVLEEGDGELLPGFDEEWAVERRLRHRAGLVGDALAASRSAHGAGRADEALALAERACTVDPLDAEAAQWRIGMLDRTGRRMEAITENGAYRRRVIRELGFVPESTGPEVVMSENPLGHAVEWALARDPDEACAMLAATVRQWLTLSVDYALDVHRRVLAASVRPSRDRQMVEAGAWMHEVIAGDLGDRLGIVAERCRAARESGETAIVALLGEALAYGSLSRGDFAAAAAYGRENLRAAEERGEPLGIANAEHTLGILELHIGDTASSVRRAERAAAIVEEHGTLVASLGVQSTLAGRWITIGRFDKAAERIDRLRRTAATYGCERMMPWFHALDAELHEALGDFAAARSALERLRRDAPAAGQCAVAVADEGLMRIDCRLGEYDAAATAWGRVARYRRGKGTVASRYEQALNRPAVRAIRERLAPRDLAAAFAKK